MVFCTSWNANRLQAEIYILNICTGITCLKDMLLSVKDAREKFTTKVKSKTVTFSLVEHVIHRQSNLVKVKIDVTNFRLYRNNLDFSYRSLQ